MMLDFINSTNVIRLYDAVNSSTAFNIGSTFLEGLLSFTAPCVLPLVPGYLSFVSGVSIVRRNKPVTSFAMSNGSEGGIAVLDAKAEQVETASLQRIVSRILTFIAGFTVAFVLLFGIYDALTSVFGDFRSLVQLIAGIIVIIFGLHFMGVFRLPFLNIERRFQMKGGQPASYIGAFVLGFAFAFGWSPCVGPFLTTAITQASNGGTGTFGANILPGIALMIIYSAGLGVPFLLAGLFVNRFLKFMARVRRHFQIIEIASGLLMVVVGFLIITNNLSALAIQFNGISL